MSPEELALHLRVRATDDQIAASLAEDWIEPFLANIQDIPPERWEPSMILVVRWLMFAYRARAAALEEILEVERRRRG